jgi:WD40 repeat protein
VQDIIPIIEQKTLVTCGLDGKICLWDFPAHTYKKSLDGHKNGLYSLTEKHQQLISGGLDHEVIVWNPYVNDPIFRLSDHSHPLVGVKVLEGTS